MNTISSAHAHRADNAAPFCRMRADGYWEGDILVPSLDLKIIIIIIIIMREPDDGWSVAVSTKSSPMFDVGIYSEYVR